MAKHVEFYYDFGSPASYVAHKRLPGVAERTGAVIDHRPVLLGGVFKATGNRSPVEVKAKGAWFWADIRRFTDRYGIVLQPNSAFPINTLYLMRGAFVAERDGRLGPYADAVFDAIWVHDRNLNDPAVVASVLTEAGFDAPAIFAAIEDGAIKSALRDATDAAVARGIFGAPTFFVDGTMYFGQDRLDFVEEQLRQ
jgi:2-hydroxychromene-2-carboxylate isomerase